MSLTQVLACCFGGLAGIGIGLFIPWLSERLGHGPYQYGWSDIPAYATIGLWLVALTGHAWMLCECLVKYIYYVWRLG